jgi:hypothetical protein
MGSPTIPCFLLSVCCEQYFPQPSKVTAARVHCPPFPLFHMRAQHLIVRNQRKLVVYELVDKCVPIQFISGSNFAEQISLYAPKLFLKHLKNKVGRIHSSYGHTLCITSNFICKYRSIYTLYTLYTLLYTYSVFEYDMYLGVRVANHRAF